MKVYKTFLSFELLSLKVKIEKELLNGNKTNQDIYVLINKAINFLKSGRVGEPISKKLPLFKYFNKKYDVTNLSLIKLNSEARAIYTYQNPNEFEVLQIILEIHETHKEYEKRGSYNKH